MSASPFGYGATPIPNADPDDMRRLLIQRGFDPSQMPAFQRVQGGPAIAEDEASVQRLEQQQAVAPPARAGIADLFDAAPMGAPQQFAGSAGARLPSDAVEVPLPPARPATFGFGGDAPDPTAPRPMTPPPMVPPQADVPVRGAQPIAAPPQAGIGMPAPGPRPAGAPDGPAPSPAAPAPAPAAAEPPSFFDNLMGGIRENSGLLTDLGMGLMSTPGWGQAIAVGLKANRDNEQKRAVSDLAKAEHALKLRKLAREEGSDNVTAKTISERLRIPYEQARGLASNKEFVNAFLNRNFNAPEGWERKEDGSLAPTPGGPQDPAVIGKRAEVQAAGTAAGNPPRSKWSQIRTPDGGTILYDESDPTKNQLSFPGQPTRPATAEELQAYGISPGQAVKMTKDGPVAIGGSNTPQVKTFELRDGSKVERQWDPTTNTWAEPSYGANPPTAQAPTNPFATGKFNEGQGKAAGFADRMLGSEQILRGLETVNQGAITGTIGGLLPNPLKSEDRQKLEQSQRDFINAQLRRESGAAISPSEFSNAEKQYFPQPGDTDAVIAQKRTNRQRAIEAMGREGGPAYAPSKKFDETGAIVPSMTPADRFKQLRGAGLSKADAYARMHTEGY